MISKPNQYSMKTYIFPTVKYVSQEHRVTLSKSVSLITIRRYTERDMDYIIRMFHHNFINQCTQHLITSQISKNRNHYWVIHRWINTEREF